MTLLLMPDLVTLEACSQRTSGVPDCQTFDQPVASTVRSIISNPPCKVLPGGHPPLHNGQAIPCLTLPPSSNSPVACFIHRRMSPEMELLADGLRNILDRHIPACREEPQSGHLAIRVEELQRALASLPATVYSPWRRAWFVFSSSNSALTTARTSYHGGHGRHGGHSFLVIHRRACRGRAAADLTVTF